MSTSACSKTPGRYVGPRAPPRGTEKFHWRVYGGANNVTVNVTPAQPGFPINLEMHIDDDDIARAEQRRQRVVGRLRRRPANRSTIDRTRRPRTHART